MRIVGSGTSDNDMRPYTFEMEGRAVGINDPEKEVIIEVQDLTHTVHIHATFEELERAYQFCKAGKTGKMVVVKIFVYRDGFLVHEARYQARNLEAVRSYAQGFYAWNNIERVEVEFPGGQRQSIVPRRG